MNKKLIIGIVAFTLGGLMLAADAFGQLSASNPETAIQNTTLMANPGFLITIIAGVLMALGFQFILTNLSVVLGITALGNLKEKTRKINNKKGQTSEEYEADEKNHNSTNTGFKIMSAAGAWGLITGSISLFFASMLAVNLSLINSNIVGFTLGLVIWVVASMIMIYIESKAIGSIVGGLWGAAVKAIKEGFSGMNSIFEKNDSERTKGIVNTLKDEANNFIQENDLNDKINTVIEKVRPKYDTHQFRKELASLLNDIKIEQKAGITPREKELYLRVAEKQPYFSKTDVSNLSTIFESVLAKVGLSGVSRQMGGLGKKASDLVQEKLPNIKEEIVNYVTEKSISYTNPEIVRAEVDEIFNHVTPDNIIRNKGKVFNKNNVATIVAEQKHISKGEALFVANQLEDALNNILKDSKIKEMVSSRVGEVKDNFEESWNNKKEEYKKNIETRFENLFRNIDRPELDYHLLKKEFNFMVNNPKLAPEVLKMKLNQMDRNSLVALLSAGGFLNKAESENVINRFEEIKDKAINRLNFEQERIKRKTEEATQFAIDQSEKARKTAIAASLWILVMLVATAIAAGLGGMLGM